MKQKHTFLRRALSLVLSFAVVFPATLALIGDSGTAQAAGTKTSISVLAIEPSDSDLLTKATIAGWTGYATSAISITYVSTLEFNGILEDLSENYDLIYVGDNGGSGNADLNLDASFLYANIGAEYTMPEGAVGLTDAEYQSTYLTSPYGTYHDLKNPSATRYSGNDLTAAQLAALNKYAVEGHPVLYGSGLTSGTVQEASPAVTFTANMSYEIAGAYVKLTAAPVVISGTLPTSTPTYTWYRGTTVVGTNSATYTVTTASIYQYYCMVSYTVNGNVYYANSNRLSIRITTPTRSTPTGGATGTAVCGAGTYRYTGTESISLGILTASASRASGLNITSAVYTYQWFNYSSGAALTGVSSDNTYIPTVTGTYYCKIGVTSLVYSGTTYSVTSNSPLCSSRRTTVTITAPTITAVSSPPATSIVIPAVTAQNFTINKTTVDDCSNMFRFLDDNKSRVNIMRTTDIFTASLFSAINLSKASINLTAYPTDYTSITGATLTADSGSSPATYTLSYTFSILNDTDPTPASTSYYCYLAIDSNADGDFSTGERLSDLVIKAGGTVVASGSLKSGTVYTATRTLPAGTYGIIPWQLKVIDTGAGIINASRIGYTRLAPVAGKAKVLDILQINSSSGLSLDNTTNASLNGSGTLNTTWFTFNTLFSAVSADYDINIQTVTTSALNSIGTTAIKNEFITGKPSYSSAADFINSYDMVIMGIGGTDTGQTNQANGTLNSGDGITDYNLNEATTNAIAEYLENKPVLFTHDTTSWMNLPYPYEATWNGNNNVNGYYPFFGYFINTALRDPFGLDRYGVTNDTYGHTKMSEPGLSSSGLVARGYSGITDDDKTALLGDGYSIAYLPGSNKATYVTSTQGFSNYISTISHSSTTTATTVSQVNEGQVSSYPYDINSGTFARATTATATVASTHAQYYQVNMNSADTSVFYCLNNSAFKFNDVSNAPYIYRRGNVTFSDFGNTVGSLSSSAETQLFVNTIIAAYGTATTASEVKFSDASGSKILTNFLMPTDDFGILTTSGSTGKDRNLYFTISGGASIVSATIWYDPDEPQIPATIYDSTGTAVVSSSALESNQKYYVKIDDIWNNLPSDLQDDFNSDSINVIPITITVRSGSIDTTAKVYLRKLLLFNLS
ncbi:MAG: hypothetical protein CVU91_10160 [Firmicutes bacterium HGW-Firmicutes-16]|nr:MAG: hypothetical protein CVU91_10160 [Firmicutes bacterium HGW-Firmicutes-16]